MQDVVFVIMQEPARGDVVSYHGKFYYCQPWASSYNLYVDVDDIGNLNKIILRVPKHTVLSR